VSPRKTGRPGVAYPPPTLPGTVLYQPNHKQFMADIVDMCASFQLRAYFTWNSRKSPSGFPDLVIVGSRLIYRELKVPPDTLSPAQCAWRDDLVDAGEDWDVWEPCDWPRRIERELRAIRKIRSGSEIR
jgi:hypothetical protein